VLLDGTRQPSMRRQEPVLVFPDPMSAFVAMKSSTGKGEMVQGMRLVPYISCITCFSRFFLISSPHGDLVSMLQVNLLLFLRFGGFRTIGERLLRIGLEPQDPTLLRTLNFEYTNQARPHPTV
jgi:hypothetical protein